MASDPEGVVSFEAGGKKYTAVFGFRAMKATEVHFGGEGEPMPFFRAIQEAMPKISPEDAADPAKIAQASADIRIGDVGKLFEFALIKHHPDLTEDQVADLIDDLGLERTSEIIGQALVAALSKQEGDAGSPGGPPKGGRSRKIG